MVPVVKGLNIINMDAVDDLIHVYKGLKGQRNGPGIHL